MTLRDKLKENLLKRLSLSIEARECISNNGTLFTIELYGHRSLHCCYSGDCPAQKLSDPYRPYCKLYLPRESE